MVVCIGDPAGVRRRHLEYVLMGEERPGWIELMNLKTKLNSTLIYVLFQIFLKKSF
jgi:hypothetical protein